MSLRERIEQLASRDADSYSADDLALFAEFKAALNRGEIIWDFSVRGFGARRQKGDAISYVLFYRHPRPLGLKQNVC